MADNIVHTSVNDVNDKPLSALNPLPTPRDKDEPPSQWAASTIDALAPGPPGLHSADKPPGDMAAVTSTYNTPAYPPSTATTPGHEFPGAFPRGHGQPQSGVTTQDVRDAAASAMETAKGYAISAKDAVGGYLPSSVAAYLPQSRPTDKNAADPNPNGEPNADPAALENTPSTGRQPSDNTLALPQSETETMRDSDSIVDNKSVATTSRTLSSHQQDNVDEPSTDASTRSLAGSRADTWSRTATPGANSMLGDSSVNENADSNTKNGDGTPKTSASAAVEAQANHSTQRLDDNSNSGETNLERPDIQHHGEETRHIPSDSSPPDPAATKSASSIHPDSPNTAGREYPFSSGEEKTLREGRPDTMKGFIHGSVDSTKATPGHGPVGTQENKGNLQSLVDSAKATAGHGSSVDSTKAAPGHGPMGGTQDKGKGEADIGMLPSTRGVNAALNTNTEKTPTSSGSATATPKDADVKPKTAMQAGDDAPLGIGPTPPSHHAKSDSDSANSKEKQKTKSGFMDKIRGEMKVLSGKLEHDQEKVEEGRRMMGKPTAGNKN